MRSPALKITTFALVFLCLNLLVTFSQDDVSPTDVTATQDFSQELPLIATSTAQTPQEVMPVEAPSPASEGMIIEPGLTPQMPTLLPTTTATPVIPETPEMTVTATATLEPPEPGLSLLSGNPFSPGWQPWMAGTHWEPAYSASDFAVSNYFTNDPAYLINNNLFNVVIEAKFLLREGAFQLRARENAEEVYVATIDANGQIQLQRGSTTLESVSVGALDQNTYHELRFSLNSDLIRVVVDDIEVISYLDEETLPAGRLSFMAVFPTDNPMSLVVVDELNYWIPEVDVSSIILEPNGTYPTEEGIETTGLTTFIPVPLESVIAFDHWAGASSLPIENGGRQQELYIVDADTISGHTWLEIITNMGSIEAHPRISPDGTKLVFSSTRATPLADDVPDIYLVDLMSPGITFPSTYASGFWRPVTSSQDFQDNSSVLASATEPFWSPDGQQIVFQSNNTGVWKIYIMNADGSGSARRVTNSDPGIAEIMPIWSSLGEIAYTNYCAPDGDIYLTSAHYVSTGGNCSNLLSSRIVATSKLDYANEWSPNGIYLSYTSYDSCPSCSNLRDVFVRHRLGISLSLLVSTTVIQSGVNLNLSYNAPNTRDNWRATWSPQGDKLAFVSKSSIAADPSLQIANLSFNQSGSNITLLNPTWTTNLNTLPIYVGYGGYHWSPTMPNLIRNGKFNTVEPTGVPTYWQVYGTPTMSAITYRVLGGVFEFYRNAGTTSAVVIQPTNTALPALTPFEVTFNLANSSPSRKRVTLIIHESNFSDQQSCVFWLEASAPMRTFKMRSYTNVAWANATFSLYDSTAYNGGWLRLDEVSMRQVPGASTTETQCFDPTPPVPVLGGANYIPIPIQNGTFRNPVLQTPWWTAGVITTRFNNGSFEFYGSNTSNDASVFLNTGQLLAPRQPLELRMDIGNSSPSRRRIQVILNDGYDWSDLQSCNFWIPPNTPLQTYVMQTFNSENSYWTALNISIYDTTSDGTGWVQLDNLSLNQRPSMRTIGTVCGTELPFCPASAGLSSAQECPSDFTLQDYGIVLEGSWTSAQQLEILTAAYMTGKALSNHGAATDVPTAFRSVMQRQNGGSWKTIKFTIYSGEGCITTKNPSTDVSASIACNPSQITQYTVAHEFGHVLVGASTTGGNSIFLDSLSNPGGPGTALAVNGQLVIGPRTINIQGRSLPDWQRSDYILDNGWGSAALWDGQYYQYDAPSVPAPTPTGFPIRVPRIGPCQPQGRPLLMTPYPLDEDPYPFQQNPCTFPDEMESTPTGTDIELEEAAGDMFLNWVYWRANGGSSGFSDKHWRYSAYINAVNCYPYATPSQCNDSNQSGQARATWMNQLMNTIFNNFQL